MRITIALLLIALSSPVFASKEGVLPLDRLQVESEGLSESGPVKVRGTQSSTGMTSLRVEAFGRSIELSTEQLTALHGGLYNLIQLSYERGYKELGGRTIYIKLATAFTSGEDASVFVSISEDGKVKISKRL